MQRLLPAAEEETLAGCFCNGVWQVAALTLVCVRVRGKRRESGKLKVLIFILYFKFPCLSVLYKHVVNGFQHNNVFMIYKKREDNQQNNKYFVGCLPFFICTSTLYLKHPCTVGCLSPTTDTTQVNVPLPDILDISRHGNNNKHAVRLENGHDLVRFRQKKQHGYVWFGFKYIKFRGS